MYSLTATSFDSSYAPAYLANGLIGVRLGPVPFQNGTVCVNGLVGRSEVYDVEARMPAPFPLAADIEIGGISLRRCPNSVHIQKQILDISCGEPTTFLKFETATSKTQIKVVDFASRSIPSLICQEIELVVDRPCQIKLIVFIDSAEIPGRYLACGTPGNELADIVLWWETPGGLSTLGAALHSELCGVKTFSSKRGEWAKGSLQLKEYNLKIKHQEKLTLRQIGSLVPSLMHPEPHLEAIRLIGYSKYLGFEKIRQNNHKRWTELWKSRVKVGGADAQTQKVLDSAFFYLHSSVHPSSPCSIAPFGLSNRYVYSGHIFWHTETWMFPPVLLTGPESARAMLDYRSRLVPAARQNAALMGFRGIMFPWQSGNSGSEVTPVWASGGILEHHITPDVALAFAQYVHVTGDEIFLREEAWPVLREVAEWILSRVTLTERGYEILNVIGPDESIVNINNSAYSNAVCICALRKAQWAARYLGYESPPEWEEVAKRIVLDVDSNNVLIKHDGYEYQEKKMLVADTLLTIFPLDFPLKKEVEEATLRWYLKHTDAHTRVPMLPTLMSVCAARLGDRALTTKFWEEGWKSYWRQPFGQFAEWKDTDETVFVTNAAGLLNAVMIGLTGLIIGPGGPKNWCAKKIILPEGWREIEISQIWIRGKNASLRAKDEASHAEIHFE